MNFSSDLRSPPECFALSRLHFSRACRHRPTGRLKRLHVSRMLRTIWPTLHRASCSHQSSQSKARRSGEAVSCRLPSGTYVPVGGPWLDAPETPPVLLILCHERKTMRMILRRDFPPLLRYFSPTIDEGICSRWAACELRSQKPLN